MRERLTFKRAMDLFGNRKEQGMDYSLHNDGTQYEIRDESGLVVAAFTEFADAARWIREQQPHLPPHHGFAPTKPDSLLAVGDCSECGLHNEN